MPKVILTQAQRERERQLAYQRTIADALVIARSRDYGSAQAMADKTGVSARAIRRMLNGDFTAQVPADKLLVLLDLANRYMRMSRRDAAAGGIDGGDTACGA